MSFWGHVDLFVLSTLGVKVLGDRAGVGLVL